MSALKFLPKGWKVGTNGSKFDQLLQPRVVGDGLELGCNLFGLGAETCDQKIDNCAAIGLESRFASRITRPLGFEFF